ncbi:MAG: hypothetical protein HY656_07770 [Acidobacteria bacterium]|nr:hypothetical protein [Acidobacteriota bacterium]
MNRLFAVRHGITLGLVALLALDAGAYFGWVRRPVGPFETEPAQVEHLAQEVAARAAEVARLERVRELAPGFGPRLDQFGRERFLPESTGFSAVAAELEEVAQNSGVFLGRVSYQTGVERLRPGLLRVDMATSVQGQYDELLDYLEQLERSPHFYLTSSLTLASARGGQVRLEMRLITYFRRGAA